MQNNICLNCDKILNKGYYYDNGNEGFVCEDCGIYFIFYNAVKYFSFSPYYTTFNIKDFNKMIKMRSFI